MVVVPSFLEPEINIFGQVSRAEAFLFNFGPKLRKGWDGIENGAKRNDSHLCVDLKIFNLTNFIPSVLTFCTCSIFQGMFRWGQFGACNEVKIKK